MTWLDRLILPKDGLWRWAPEVVSDAAHRRYAFLVGVATLAAFGAFVHGHLVEAGMLTPEITRSVLTQVGFSSIAQATVDAIGGVNPVTPAVEFLSGAYSVFLLYTAVLPFDDPGSVPAVVLLRILVAALNLAGAPLLYVGARRAGLRARSAAFVAVAYLLAPPVTWKISWDIIGFSGTMLVAAYVALQARRSVWALLALFFAAGSHPFSLWAITWWVLLEWRSSVCAGAEDRVLRLGFAWFALQSAWALFLVFLAPLLWTGTLIGYMENHVAEGRFLVERFPVHVLLAVGMLGSTLFLPVLRARWLWLLVADAVYYLGTGTNHGLIPSTTGVLAIASVEGLRSLREGAGPSWLQWARVPGPRTVFAGAALLGVLLAIDVVASREHQYRHVLMAPDWDGAWIPDIERLAGRIPAEVDLCLVQPTLFPIVSERCPIVMPWTWPESGARVQPWMERFAVVIDADLYDTRRYPRRTMPQEADDPIRREICGHLADGSWHVAVVEGSACLLRPSGPASGGAALSCPALCTDGLAPGAAPDAR